MSASLLAGAGIPIPPSSALLERIGDVDRYDWRFPVIVQPGREHAGIGLERDSIVHTKKDLRAKVRHILATYRQPALAQHFLTGREFNVGIIGGRKPQVLPLAEVDYSRLPDGIPPMMSYAAKWEEQTVEYQGTSIICPAEVEPVLAERIRDVALRAFRAVGGWGYEPGRHASRRGRGAPGARGQLQPPARPGRGSRALRRARGHQLPSAAREDRRRRVRGAALRPEHPARRTASGQSVNRPM